MKNQLKLLSVIVVAILMTSCVSSKLSPDEVKAKVYSNNFSFVAKEYDNNTSYSAPLGTGRIASTNIPQVPDEAIGIQVTHDKLVINLPSNDNETKTNNYSLNKVSEDFTVARKELSNGNILVNFFLNDHKDIKVVKMEIGKDGKIDCSVEGSNLQPLYYVGYLQR
ncbi:DUF4251 domain-containing protein [Kaistella sp. 97-N-M2]|uniref:DUF4251 domain-containing protein n=1 Tax=Kaistella sp. 97-N-M2 TaxID=2908645 RepID=UPI001F1A8736|nr:DUF4251 domain-containing protein [Kaistella sp. 97-N-M2]UJF28631.1 DUF4251 domain-containing protein [Kaistella sp. 97-N-M2]